MTTEPFNGAEMRDLPLRLLDATIVSLNQFGIVPCVIGSLSLLEHLPSARMNHLTTEDVDILVALDDASQVLDVSRAMSHLGLGLPRGRSGKWKDLAGGDAEVDIIARTVPVGFAEPACLAEPFANVIALDRHRPSVLPHLIRGTSYKAFDVAGPTTTVLGKCLKVSRYIGLQDWNTNEHRRARAIRAARDILMVVEHNRIDFGVRRFDDLAASTQRSGSSVRTTLDHAIRALESLFGDVKSPGFRLAERSTGFECDAVGMVSVVQAVAAWQAGPPVGHGRS